MSWSEMCTWNDDTPAIVPAGARISAGKLGKVARSLPKMALASVNRSPAICMPSPESPANRITTSSISSGPIDVSAVTSLTPLCGAECGRCQDGARAVGLLAHCTDRPPRRRGPGLDSVGEGGFGLLRRVNKQYVFFFFFFLLLASLRIAKLPSVIKTFFTSCIWLNPFKTDVLGSFPILAVPISCTADPPVCKEL